MAGNVSDYKIILCVTLSKGKKINREINKSWNDYLKNSVKIRKV
jgi:hypothetical protein